MESRFRFIAPGEIVDWHEVMKAVDAEGSGTGDAVFDAVSLADGAAAFFRGAFPLWSPYFWWGDSIPLPWMDDYFTRSADGETVLALPISEEVERIAEILASTASKEQVSEPWAQLTYLSPLAANSKSKTQGLAVEAMLAVDGFLRLVSRSCVAESLSWLSAAYKGIIECTCQAQENLGYASENARKAATARHRENYAMKEQVFKWCAKHLDEFKSMDAASEAVAGKLVPVTFRTVRSWIGEYRRNRQSARRP